MTTPTQPTENAENSAGAPDALAEAAGAAAGLPIGRVETASGTVTVIHADGNQEPLGPGALVHQGDTLETGAGAAVSVVLADDTMFSMAENGTMVLDEVVYDPATLEGSISLSAAVGIFTFVSGEVAKSDPESMLIETPVASIGIRGTQAGLNVGAEETVVVLMEEADGFVGEVVVTNEAGVQVINVAENGVTVSSAAAAPTAPVHFGRGLLLKLFGGALDALPTGYNANKYGLEEASIEELLQETAAEEALGGEELAEEELGEEELAEEELAEEELAGEETERTEEAPEDLAEMETAAGGEEEAGVTGTIRTVAGDYTGGVEAPGVEAPAFVLGALGGTATAPAPATQTTERIVETPAPVPAAKPVAQAPALAVTAAATAEDQPAALVIVASLADSDGTETLEITVAGVPEGAVLSAGVDNGDGTWTLSADQLEGLTLTPPPGSGADFELTVTATATKAGGDTASTAATLGVSVAALADAPEVAVAAAATAEDVPVGLNIQAKLAAAAGDEEISAITIAGVPKGAVLSAGIDGGGGTWTLAPGDLEGLTLTPAADSSADFALRVSATTVQTDPDSGERTTATAGPVTLAVSVAAVADRPILRVSDISVGGGGGEPGNQTLHGTGGADTLIGGAGDDILMGGGGDDVLYGDSFVAGRATVPIDVMAALADTDFSESLTVTIAGVPEGAELSAGAKGGDGTWTLIAEQLEGLTMTLPEGFDRDFQMLVTATATDIDVDTGAADTAAASATIDVTFAEDGGAGDDILHGGGGDDVLFGGGGDDVLKGEGGDDTLYGGDGDDVLEGGGGDDILYGGAGDDVLKGGGGADTLYGGAGDDVLEGGGGDDILFGGTGDDVLEGGGGADTFVFAPGDGSDTVTDFKRGDALHFKGDAFSLDDLSIAQVGDDAVISFQGRGVEVTVRDTDAASLQGYQITPAGDDASGVAVNFLE